VLFTDRADAGRRLGKKLAPLRGSDILVLGLPRGGVPVAYEVARELNAPMDVIVVRKLGVPFQPELAMGAVGEGGIRIINDQVVRGALITPQEVATAERRERQEVERQAQRFRAGRPRVDVAGRTVVVVDDGIATGSTARAACQVARHQGAARVILAAPVGSPSSADALRGDCDDVLCLHAPASFSSVGQWYADFSPVPDAEVTALLQRAAGVPTDAAAPVPGGGSAADVRIEAGAVVLPGHLTVPGGAAGVVVFAHGSGSSQYSPRNQHVAGRLYEAGLGTLLFDLLTPEEEADRANVFDIRLLASRLTDVTAWLRGRPEARQARIGYFGASTGAAAALWAAAEPDADIAAVVSRGGRPDLAGSRLSSVRAPTLLIVGGRDDIVLGLNRLAMMQLRCESRLAVVPGATHLFEEPGALQAVTDLARDWFIGHLRSAVAHSA
jgi:putative phosphoribosyl transferase